MSTSDGPPPCCTMCHEAAFDRCGGCNDARFCSENCQKADRPVHKFLCNKLVEFSDDKRPSPDHYRAIKFDAEKDGPEFFWLYAPADTEYGGSRPDIKSLFGSYQTETAGHFWNARQNKHFRPSLYMTVVGFPDHAQCKQNCSIDPILWTDGQHINVWRGLVTFYADSCDDYDAEDDASEFEDEDEEGSHERTIKDLDMADFRHAVDVFLSQGKFTVEAPSTPSSSEPTVQGVSTYLPPSGPFDDEIPQAKGYFEAAKKPLYHSIFHKHNGSDIAQRVGIPLLIQQLPKDYHLWSKNARRHPQAEALHLSCDPARNLTDPSQETWAKIPAKWVSCAGDMLIVRKDKKPLHVKHLKALAEYCRTVARPAMRKARKSSAAREEVLHGINPAAFAAFWESYKRRKGYKVGSPYE